MLLLQEPATKELKAADYPVDHEIPKVSIVLTMALRTAQALEIRIANPYRLHRTMCLPIPMPRLFESNAYRLWVDRYYIAFQAKGKGSYVIYAYLTKHFIANECADDMRLREQNGIGFLDRATRRQFRDAMRAMQLGNGAYAIRDGGTLPEQQWSPTAGWKAPDVTPIACRTAAVSPIVLRRVIAEGGTVFTGFASPDRLMHVPATPA